jgi:hypothetical protein
MEALNKTLALVLWAKDENGDDDVAVFPGTLIQEKDLYFLQRGDEARPEIRAEWLSRIKKVPDDLKETLSNCEFQLSLTVGNTENETATLEAFGLKWPK